MFKTQMHKKINFITVIWILFYFFIFLFLLKNSYSYLDPDLGWHLRVGQDILREKSVPGLNYYNYTLEGTEWVDHEWLMDAFVFWLYRNFGYLAINIIFALLIVATLIIQNIYLQKNYLVKNQGIIFIILFQVLGIIAMAPHLGVRMQEITILCLLLLFIIIHRFSHYKSSKTLWWLIPLFYFWANAHAGFLIGLFILFFWLIIKLAESFLPIIDRGNGRSGLISYSRFSRRRLLVFASFSLLSLLVTLFTPYRLKLYAFLGSYQNTFYMSHIKEWLNQSRFPILYWQLIFLAITLIAVSLIIYLSKQKNNIPKYNIKLWDILIILLFTVLSFKSKRHFPLFFIASFPFLIYFYSSFFDFPDQWRLEKIAWRSLVARLSSAFFAIAFLALIANLFFTIKFTDRPFASYCAEYPCAAVNFLKNNPVYANLNLFNHYDFGGYLIWVWPEKKLFIDGRLPQYKFSGHTLLEEYFEFFKEGEAEKKLDNYGIKLVLLKVENQSGAPNWWEKYFFPFKNQAASKANFLKNYLETEKTWQLIYRDEISRAYLKTN